MWEPFRQSMIAEHRFYVEQARKRLLSQFDNMEAEAEKATNEYLEKMSSYFNPDIHDPSDFYDSANDKGIEFYQLLSEMHDNTRISVIAGMYHQWDKKIREWIIQEIRYWHSGENAAKSIWKACFSEIIDFFISIKINVHQFPGYDRLDAMRLIVNVFKHGNGTSLEELKSSYPEFLSGSLGDKNYQISLSFTDHTHLKVSDLNLDQFSEAILTFWGEIPKEIYLNETLDPPAWFERALLKDRKAT